MTQAAWPKLFATFLIVMIASSLTKNAYAWETTIVGVKNYSDQGVYIRSTEMNHGTWIPAGESSWTDIKVPWARYAGTGWYGFEEHHIWIEHPRGTIKYVIGKAMRLTATGFVITKGQSGNCMGTAYHVSMEIAL